MKITSAMAIMAKTPTTEPAQIKARRFLLVIVDTKKGSKTELFICYTCRGTQWLISNRKSRAIAQITMRDIGVSF
jgi:hypothetical protein